MRNDLTALRDAWPAPAPRDEAVRAARGALLAHARRRGARRRRTLRPRLALVAGLAVIVAGVIGAQQLRDSSGGHGVLAVPAASAAIVLKQAATAAERRPFTAPEDDQWIYTKDEIVGSDGAVFTRATWRRADGGGFAIRDDHGKLHVEQSPRPSRAPFDSYKSLAALPAEPAALRRWAYAQTPHVTGAGSTDDAEAFNLLRGLLQGGMLSPRHEAAVFRALAQVPGVRVRAAQVDGAPALAVGQTDEWLRQELLLDADTYAYRGQRSTVVKDARLSPEKAGNRTGEVKQGSTVTSRRVAAAVVDRPGERR